MSAKTLAILSQKTKSWHAGESYTNGLLASLSLARSSWEGEILFASDNLEKPEKHGFKCVQIPDSDSSQSWEKFIEEHRIDILMPIRDHRIDYVPCKKVGWIPDFQHLRMPELFDLNDLIWRDRLFSRVAGLSDLLIISSNSANFDFADFFPSCAQKARVAPFPSQLWAGQLAEQIDVVSKYHLPKRFFLVANQFWKHKNHKILPQAVAAAREAGVDVNLVLTGQPVDYRDPDNVLLSNIFQECSNLGIRDSFVFLGQVPRGELLSLLRCSIAVIQPSKFEGWNTTIEDAKAIGKPVICSAISVHREQMGTNGYFFESDSIIELVDQLKLASKEWGSGINRERESLSLEKNKKAAYTFGKSLFSIANEALSLNSTQGESSIPKLPERNSIDLEQQLNLSTIIQQQADYISILEKKCTDMKSSQCKKIFKKIQNIVRKIK